MMFHSILSLSLRSFFLSLAELPVCYPDRLFPIPFHIFVYSTVHGIYLSSVISEG